MARIPKVVADASLVCKWFIPEIGSEGAVALREAHTDGRVRITAPDLLCYEFSNALRHHSSVSRDQLRAAVRDLFDLQIGLVHPSSEILAESRRVRISGESDGLRCVLRGIG